jgi:release factor glutamine methyltransferase
MRAIEAQQSLNVRQALRQAMARLRQAAVPSHTLAAELLLMHTLGRDRAWLYAHPEEPLSPAAAARYFDGVAKRASGMPTQYITGKQEFWGLQFEVTPDVLIPRPETEHVVEVALDRLGLRQVKDGRAQTTRGAGLRIADVGIGSGCIAVAMARELPEAQFYATDISPAALEVARRNAERHGVADRIHFAESDLLSGLPDEEARFDLIVSNPPYISLRDIENVSRETFLHEPRTALFAGEDGMAFYPELIAQAAKRLIPGGLLVLELGYDSLLKVWPLLETPEWTNLGVTHDLAGIPRVIAAERL